MYHTYQQYVERGETPEAIASSYGISVADVHAALAYAFGNPDEMRDVESQNQQLYEAASPSRVAPDEDA